MGERNLGRNGGAISGGEQRGWQHLSAPLEAPRGEDVQDSLSRVSRGEPVREALIDDLASTIRQLVAEPDTSPSISFRKLQDVAGVHLDNRYACRPFLNNALEPGQDDLQHARSEYEQRRLIQLDFIPEYARSKTHYFSQRPLLASYRTSMAMGSAQLLRMASVCSLPKRLRISISNALLA